MTTNQLRLFRSGEEPGGANQSSADCQRDLGDVVNLSDYFKGGRPSSMQRQGLHIRGSYIDDTAAAPQEIASTVASDMNVSEKRFITHTEPSGYNKLTEPTLKPYFFGAAKNRVRVFDDSLTRVYSIRDDGGGGPARHNFLNNCLMKPYSAEVVAGTMSGDEEYYLETPTDKDLYTVSELEGSVETTCDDGDASSIAEYHDTLEQDVLTRLSSVAKGSNRNVRGAIAGEPYRRDWDRPGKKTRHEVFTPVLYLFGGSAPK